MITDKCETDNKHEELKSDTHRHITFLQQTYKYFIIRRCKLYKEMHRIGSDYRLNNIFHI